MPFSFDKSWLRLVFNRRILSLVFGGDIPGHETYVRHIKHHGNNDKCTAVDGITHKKSEKESQHNHSCIFTFSSSLQCFFGTVRTF